MCAIDSDALATRFDPSRYHDAAELVVGDDADVRARDGVGLMSETLRDKEGASFYLVTSCVGYILRPSSKIAPSEYLHSKSRRRADGRITHVYSYSPDRGLLFFISIPEMHSSLQGSDNVVRLRKLIMSFLLPNMGLDEIPDGVLAHVPPCRRLIQMSCLLVVSGYLDLGLSAGEGTDTKKV